MFCDALTPDTKELVFSSYCVCPAIVLYSSIIPLLAMLSGVVGIVSGGSSGLGAAAARCLVRNGGKVVVADLPHQRDAFLQAFAEDDGTNAVFSETDVQDTNQIIQALDLAESTFGEPVNAAISCAGICPAKKTLSSKRSTHSDGSTTTTTTVVHPLDIFSQTMKINVEGTFNLARLAAERMATRQPEGIDGLRGCIIHTASIAAYEGQMGQVAYAASKGAVVGMTLPMARDLAQYGIRVMTIVSS
jgi:3-hydroxyacyl-CoA dehydrogenase/3-hydroxy-2-methylbutyryl-CoA dehydrogenase